MDHMERYQRAVEEADTDNALDIAVYVIAGITTALVLMAFASLPELLELLQLQ